jgi:hypothetical protein
MSAVWSLSGAGCVKTCPSRECAELFSLFSSFDGDRQGGSFVIERNRGKLSTRKFDVGVFHTGWTQTGREPQTVGVATPARILREIRPLPPVPAFLITNS